MLNAYTYAKEITPSAIRELKTAGKKIESEKKRKTQKGKREGERNFHGKKIK